MVFDKLLGGECVYKSVWLEDMDVFLFNKTCIKNMVFLVFIKCCLCFKIIIFFFKKLITLLSQTHN